MVKTKWPTIQYPNPNMSGYRMFPVIGRPVIGCLLCLNSSDVTFIQGFKVNRLLAQSRPWSGIETSRCHTKLMLKAVCYSSAGKYLKQEGAYVT
jgi:hypothetical protein